MHARLLGTTEYVVGSAEPLEPLEPFKYFLNFCNCHFSFKYKALVLLRNAVFFEMHHIICDLQVHFLTFLMVNGPLIYHLFPYYLFFIHTSVIVLCFKSKAKFTV